MHEAGSQATRRGLWRTLRCLAVGVFSWLLAGLALGQATPALELRQAARSIGDGPAQIVALPDRVAAPAGQPAPFQPVYRLDVDLGPAPSRMAVYLPGAFNHSRIRINGHLVYDEFRDPIPPPPRGTYRLVLAPVPDEFVRPGANRIEVTLAATKGASMSTVWIGSEDVLRPVHQRKRWWQVFAPVIAAALTFALSVCVLLLWARQPRETMYGYFGFGGVLWSLHNVWTVWPEHLVGQPHFMIWWNHGFAIFVVPLVLFCVRLAQWRLPRFEQALWLGLVAGPPLLYGANAIGILEPSVAAWRLAWIGATAVGVYAVGRYALARRDLASLLLLATGALAFGFGVRDWLVDQDKSDNNPIFLTDFSGILFFPLVAWMLIDGFVQASRQLEEMNAELERRVAAKSAELTQALEAMREAKDSAEAANRAKSSFLAAASHDLRQPMHALGLYMAALRGETVDRSQVDLIERMRASVGALDSLFDALLDVSRIDAGAVEPAPRPFDIAQMLHRLGSDFAPEAADRGLRLSVRVAPAAERLNAWSDPVLVERILRNLLANAVKYTSEGGVLLSGRLRAADSAQPQWRIEVWDSGPGIPESERERVFDEFYQLGNPERDRPAGLGLGLSIVRRLARLLGLPLQLDSRLGRGSRFAVDLPATPAAAAAIAPALPWGSLDRLGVAVIDDDPAVRDSMGVLLAQWGGDVVAGASAEEVLRLAGPRPAERLHAAVVDLQLADGRDGIGAIHALRAACGEALPALLVSGATSATWLAQVQASGLQVMTKPVAPERLRAWLAGGRFAGCTGGAPLLSRAETRALREDA